MSDLKIINLVKNFQGMDRPAVNNVNLDIHSGELVAFLGPSGCGKTTILKMITGLFDPDNGDIKLDNQTLLTTPTEKRGVVMVFQNYLLFPYMNVNENVGFALKMKGIEQSIIDTKVREDVCLFFALEPTHATKTTRFIGIARQPQTKHETSSSKRVASPKASNTSAQTCRR